MPPEEDQEEKVDQKEWSRDPKEVGPQVDEGLSTVPQEGGTAPLGDETAPVTLSPPSDQSLRSVPGDHLDTLASGERKKGHSLCR